ncbi:hypothetical protein [Phytohabitans aurantiacus]|uniref:hypothetical protein n=1 Tax=Phytohabitans aurantiacus TaxID=3016789 RepID=UPI00248FA564|nr:hypothetical protein [Phytohabitans aurantiacus]
MNGNGTRIAVMGLPYVSPDHFTHTTDFTGNDQNIGEANGMGAGDEAIVTATSIQRTDLPASPLDAGRTTGKTDDGYRTHSSLYQARHSILVGPQWAA